MLLDPVGPRPMGLPSLSPLTEAPIPFYTFLTPKMFQSRFFPLLLLRKSFSSVTHSLQSLDLLGYKHEIVF